jgi:hypothetical protein
LNKFSFFFVTVFLLSSALLPAQNTGEGIGALKDNGNIHDASPDEKKSQDLEIYIIRDISFDITGKTQPSALLYNGGIKSGEIIQGRANLDKYLSEKAQFLRNQRVLNESSIEMTLDEADAEGRIPVDISIKVVDTWNIIVIPYPKYDTNTGFDLTLKARDYNFLGTMKPLRLDLGYELANKYVDDFFSNLNKGAFKIELDSDIPFRAWGFDWNINFDHIFSYTYEQPLAYKNITGVSMELPFKHTTFTFGFEQNVIFNEENSDDDKPLYGEYFGGGFLSSELYTTWKIPVGLEIGTFGELIYTPKVYAKVKYRPAGDVDYPRKGPVSGFSHSIGFGQINWKENFRNGLEASVNNSYEYNFYKLEWANALSFSAVGHMSITDFFGMGGRLQYRQWFNNVYTEAGDVLRGITNKNLHADYMLSANMDFPFRIIQFVPSRWLNNRQFRLFDFDLHLSPIIDLAFVKDPDNQIDFSPLDLQAAGGLEIIVFPHFMRSLYLRISFSFNIRELIKTKSLPEGNNREIYIGLGHHY